MCGVLTNPPAELAPARTELPTAGFQRGSLTSSQRIAFLIQAAFDHRIATLIDACARLSCIDCSGQPALISGWWRVLVLLWRLVWGNSLERFSGTFRSVSLELLAITPFFVPLARRCAARQDNTGNQNRSHISPMLSRRKGAGRLTACKHGTARPTCSREVLYSVGRPTWGTHACYDRSRLLSRN